ncbi:F-box domain-containing protein [Caenorhabditis elegans]|uniref:F-box domain-containing protein n=1 Tax=Caenorhabditis elegans TaxID=6239 RepID=Q9XXS3_CAEEL|nr:F-box domain-containing protein [Caenorhabditis elegans]CAA16305.2 F-box domain-containing protein [Caenorhabditis elegans]|eukprot:NP_507398.2 F-box B protein [Caenorhabditis elegans]
MRGDSFPILQLPPNVLHKTLRSMQFFDLMIFSLVSKATRKATQALELAALGILVKIDQDLKITIYNGSIGFYLDIYYDRVANTRLEGGNVGIGIERLPTGTVYLKRSDLSPRQCLDHFQEVFWHYKKIFIEIDHTVTDYQSIYEEFKGIKFNSLTMLMNRANGEDEWARKCAMNFSRQCDEIDLDGEPLFTHTACEFQNLACQKFKQFHSSKKCTLNDLLVMEAKDFVSSIDFEELNLFLKFWIKGFIQHLKCVELYVESDTSDLQNIAILFKNISYEEAPNDKVFEYKYRLVCRGGRYIQSNDGITAVVGFDDFDNCVKLIVLD